MEQILVTMCIMCLIPFYTLFIVSYMPKNTPPRPKPPRDIAGSTQPFPQQNIESWWEEYAAHAIYLH